MTNDNVTRYSSVRARAIEHAFLYEMHREAWRQGEPLDVCEAEIDFRGYDLVLHWNGVTRHVQMKCTSKPSPQKASRLLEDHPSGCIVVAVLDDPDDLTPIQFGFFGGAPNEDTPSMAGFKKAKHTKGDATGHKAQRKNAVNVRKKAFDWDLPQWGDVFDKLFGEVA